MKLALRPYQEEALAAIRDAQDRGVNRALVALPTGTGKTVVFSHLISERGGTALILAHRDELLGQAEDKLRVVAPELAMSIGRIQAGRNDIGSQIVVASVASLARQARLDQLPREWNTVVVDEAHHATADSYRRILDHVQAGIVAGFTATPERHDKSRLADVFEEIVYARSLLQMISSGYLCDLRGLRVELAGLDLSDVKVSRGDYQANELGDALEAAHAPEHTAAALAEHASDRKTIVFTPTVALAHLTADAVTAAGIPAAAVDGTTPVDERRDILGRFKAGDLQAVVNCDVLTEGFDEPSVGCIAIASPTRSRIVYVQRVGRGTRLHPGKSDCLVLDLVGVTDDLKLQSLPDLFGLDKPPRKNETIREAVEREQEEHATAEERRKARNAKRRAKSADLFGRDRMHWLQLGARWVIAAGGKESVVLDPVRDGAWRVLLVGEDRARILARDLDLGYAQGAAEEAIRKRQAIALADKEAAWREREPSRGQLNYLRRLGSSEQPSTSGEASDLINGLVIGDRLDRLDRVLAAREAVA